MSDAMISTGDFEYEPPIASKAWQIGHNSVMWAGNALVNSEIINTIVKDWREQDAPRAVADVAELYANAYATIRHRKAESEILSPYGLTFETFHKQQQLSSEFVLKIDSELRAFNPVPGGLQAIVAGLDEEAHIYMLDLDHQGVMQTWCYDALGFCSIGAGGGHSDAYMMSCRHHHSADLPTTLFSVYSAKRHAEVAPGVGKRTSCLIDSYVPGQGPFGKNLVDRLSTIYDAARESIRGITLTANQEVARYVEQEIAIIKKEEADKAQVDETGIRGHPKEGEPEDS